MKQAFFMVVCSIAISSMFLACGNKDGKGDNAIISPDSKPTGPQVEELKATEAQEAQAECSAPFEFTIPETEQKLENLASVADGRAASSWQLLETEVFLEQSQGEEVSSLHGKSAKVLCHTSAKGSDLKLSVKTEFPNSIARKSGAVLNYRRDILLAMNDLVGGKTTLFKKEINVKTDSEAPAFSGAQEILYSYDKANAQLIIRVQSTEIPDGQMNRKTLMKAVYSQKAVDAIDEVETDSKEKADADAEKIDKSETQEQAETEEQTEAQSQTDYR